MHSNRQKSKEMIGLIQKEKKLHAQIRANFKKISQKIDDDVDVVIKSKSIQ
ncbi:hypothetical protein [Nitrosopumilus sp.]|uniref:hypothetical protein n=1 Tax=Nitrosopumilus sp. TaxID=2024843 RepID=UPI00247E5E87|nr:hypothetical protein [Nitrosopumilus sp.]MCV0409763.1 hypothetical protein [Nitrosopumilus sp.]